MRTEPLRVPARYAQSRLPRRRRWIAVLRVVAAGASALVLLVTCYAWSTFHALDTGLHRSGALGGLSSGATGAQNILVIGLDSRLDENGNPLPPAMYQALDTGGADVGGHNANVIMLVHIPADGSRATVISVPRDDYVALAGSPDATAKGKIKQAYGLAFDQQHRALVAEHVTDPVVLEQRSRDAGRTAEIRTVGQFLGVPVDHVVEVTMVAFYQIAQVVAPITVCVNEDTRDTFSGADLHQGYQQLDAAQAVAFVRQRRDTAHPALAFTDLDRERRQQAFIASLAYQLRQTGTLTDPARLDGLIAVAKQNTALDPGLDLTGLVGTLSELAGGNVAFATAPIDHFGKDPRGEDVNIVDPATVRATVARLLGGQPAADTTTTTPAPTGVQVDVLNDNGASGQARALLDRLTAAGYRAGTIGNGPHRAASAVEYGPGDEDRARDLATAAGVTATVPDRALPAGTLRVVLGADRPAAPVAAPTAAPATAEAAPFGAGIPCVK